MNGGKEPQFWLPALLRAAHRDAWNGCGSTAYCYLVQLGPAQLNQLLHRVAEPVMSQHIATETQFARNRHQPTNQHGFGRAICCLSQQFPSFGDGDEPLVVPRRPRHRA
jgi:hypothetical protein